VNDSFWQFAMKTAPYLPYCFGQKCAELASKIDPRANTRSKLCAESWTAIIGVQKNPATLCPQLGFGWEWYANILSFLFDH